MSTMSPNDEINRVQSASLLLGVVSFALFFAIQTLLERLRARHITKLETRLTQLERTRSELASPTTERDREILENTRKKVLNQRRLLRRARLGFQLNGIMGAYGSMPTALVVTSASDSSYSAMAIYFGSVLGAHAFWNTIQKPRHVAGSMSIAYVLISVGTLIYLAFGPGLQLIQVSEEIKLSIQNANSDSFRIVLDFRHWPTRIIVRKLWIWLMLFEWTRWKPRGIDHLKWYSPVWGFLLKLGVTAALFYGWRSDQPLSDKIHIDGKLFQYATEEWPGRHLIFLMLAVGLTFITVENRRRDGEYLLPDADRGQVSPESSSKMTFTERIRRMLMSADEIHDEAVSRNAIGNCQHDLENPIESDSFVDDVVGGYGMKAPESDITSESTVNVSRPYAVQAQSPG